MMTKPGEIRLLDLLLQQILDVDKLMKTAKGEQEILEKSFGERMNIKTESRSAAANKSYLRLLGVVLNCSLCFQMQFGHGGQLLQVGFNIPLRSIFKPSYARDCK